MLPSGYFSAGSKGDSGTDRLASAVSKIRIESGIPRTGMYRGTGNDQDILTYHRENETGGLIETATSTNQNHVTARSLNSVDDLRQTFSNLGYFQNVMTNQNKPTNPMKARQYKYPRTVVIGDNAYIPMAPSNDHPLLLRATETHPSEMLGRSSGIQRAFSDMDLPSGRSLSNGSHESLVARNTPVVSQYYRHARLHVVDGAPPSHAPPRMTRAGHGLTMLGAVNRGSHSGSPRLTRRVLSVQSLTSGQSSRDGVAMGWSSPEPKLLHKHRSKIAKDKRKVSEKCKEHKRAEFKKRSRSLEDVCSVDAGHADCGVSSSLLVTVPGPTGFKTDDDAAFGKRKKAKDRQKAARKRDDAKSDRSSGGASAELSSGKVNPPQACIDSPPRWASMGDPDMVYLGQDGHLYLTSGHADGEFYPYRGGLMYYPAIDPVDHPDMQCCEVGSSDSDGESLGRNSPGRYLDLHKKKRAPQKDRRGNGNTDDYDLFTRSRSGHRNDDIPRRSRSVSPKLRTREHCKVYHAGTRDIREITSLQEGVYESQEYNDDFPDGYIEPYTRVSHNAPLRQRKSDERYSNEELCLRKKERTAVDGRQQDQFYSSIISPQFTNHYDNSVYEPESVHSQFYGDSNPYSGFPVSVTSGPLDKLLRNTRLSLASMRSYLDAMSSSLANIPASTLSSLPHINHQADTLDQVETEEFFKVRQHGPVTAPPGLTSSLYVSENQTHAVLPATQMPPVASDPVIEDTLGHPVLPNSSGRGMLRKPKWSTDGICHNTNCYPKDTFTLKQQTGCDGMNSMRVKDEESQHVVSDMVDMGHFVSTFVGPSNSHATCLDRWPRPLTTQPQTAVESPISRQFSTVNWVLRPTRSSAVQTDFEAAAGPQPSPPPLPPPPPPLPLQQASLIQAQPKKEHFPSDRSPESLPYGAELLARLSCGDGHPRPNTKGSPPPVLPKPSWAIQRLRSQNSLSPTSSAVKQIPLSPIDSEISNSTHSPFEKSLVSHSLPLVAEQIPGPDNLRNGEDVKISVERSCSVRERVEEFSNMSTQNRQSKPQLKTRQPQAKQAPNLDENWVYSRGPPSLYSDDNLPSKGNTLPLSLLQDQNLTIIYRESGFTAIDENKGVLPLHHHTRFVPDLNRDVSEPEATFTQHQQGSGSWTNPAAHSSPRMNSPSAPIEGSTLPSKQELAPLWRCGTSPPDPERSSLPSDPPALPPLTGLHQPQATSQHLNLSGGVVTVFEEEQSQSPTTPTSPFGGVKLPGFPALPSPTKSNILQYSTLSCAGTAINGRGEYIQPHFRDSTPYQIYRGDPKLVAALSMKNRSKSNENILSRSSKRNKIEAPKTSHTHQELSNEYCFTKANVGSTLPSCSVYEMTESGFTFYKGNVAHADRQKPRKAAKRIKTSKTGPSTVYPCPAGPLMMPPITSVSRTASYDLSQTEPNPFLVVNGLHNSEASTERPCAPTQNSASDWNFSRRNGIPLPAVDFDSHEDSCEYMYTSQGWSHMLQHLPDQSAAIFCCRGVEDMSAQFWGGIYRKSYGSFTDNVIKTKRPQDLELSRNTKYENGIVLDRFFDMCIPSFKSKVRFLQSDCTPSLSKTANGLAHREILDLTNHVERTLLNHKFGVADSLWQGSPDNPYIEGKGDNQWLTKEDYFGYVSCTERMSHDYTSIFNGDQNVFMKEAFESRLDVAADAIKSAAVRRLQTTVRMFLVRSRHRKVKVAVARLQRMARMWKARRNFKTLRNGIVKAQAQFRMFRQRRRYVKTREQLKRKLEEHRLQRRKQEVEAKMELERRAASIYQQQEQQAKVMANIANLEIPGELALVYNRLDDWELFHSGPSVISALGDVVPMDMGYKLPVDINSHAFSKYTSVYFKNPTWGVKMEAIDTSLTPVQGEENNAIALAVFKLIMRYMCDKQLNEKNEKVLADFIVQMGLKHEGVRDEILCQLVNQTWLEQNMERAERGWQLMAACLCCFNPSPTLFKYLLKHVSDVGIQGFKFLCQHKVLQSAYMDPLLCRVYPPTLLEWKAIERKANMALDVRFPDDVNIIGHVESWTSGELFASHLLKLRGLKENGQGWTLQLQEDADQYELMGYDYVLDLIGETEVPPGFPAGLAHFLVSMNRERAHHKRRTPADGPHNPERERVLALMGPLPEMAKREIPIVTSSVSTQRESEEEEIGFSMTSVLNQRPTEILPVGLSEDSRMNVRYTKRSRAPGPPAMNGHVPNGIANGHITTITEDEEDGFTSADISNLSNIRLNGRYFANGDAPAYVQRDLSNSKMNLRYNKKAGRAGKNVGVSGQIIKRQNQQSYSNNSHREEGTHSDNTDWSHLVEDIFNNALETHIEQDGRALGGRIKGGGKGVPGFQQQPPPQPPNALNIGLANGALNPQPSLISPLIGSQVTLPNLGMVGNDSLQQLASQQMAQQQAVVQAFLQQQQQQQQQALIEATLQQQRQFQQQQQQQAATSQQTAALKSALQQQELQNKLLQQSIEQERLRQQLQQAQLQQQLLAQSGPSVLSPVSPNSSFNNSFSMNGSVPSLYNPALSPENHVTATSVLPGQVNGAAPVQNGVSPRVQFIKSSFETNKLEAAPPVVPRPTLNSTAAVTRTLTITSNSVANVPVNTAPAPPPAPPLAPPTVISFAEAPPLHTQPAVPPPPPPPPPPAPIEIDRERGTFTIRDKSGRARTVRIGRVVWPPPVQREERSDIQVGKLEIDESVASGIESRIAGKKWQPPKKQEPEPGQPKPILKTDQSNFKRTKSLLETSHVNTLKILEQKLGGSPAPAEVSTKKTSQTRAIETESSSGATDGNVYATNIAKDVVIPPAPPLDVPPPVPTSTPPKLTKKKTVTETVETTEVRRTTGDLYSHRIEPDNSSDYARHIGPPPAMLADPSPLALEIESKPKIDYAAFERVVTELYPQHKQFFLMYSKAPWSLHLRKEVFWPSEKLEHALALHLVYCQVVSDVYNQACVRATKEQKVKMKSLLEGYGVNQTNYLTRDIKPQVKKVIVDTAKEWPTYFCRLFPIAATGQYSGARYLGVSHTGLRLVTRERTLVEDNLSVLEDIKFEDVIDAVMPNSSTLQLNLRTKSIIFHTTRAQQLKDMVDRFCQESEKGNKYVMAVRDYITRESTLLSFKRGDIIKLMDPEMDLESGWLYGSLNGIVGLFPAEYVKHLARHEVDKTSGPKPVLYRVHEAGQHLNTARDSHGPDDHSETSQGTAVADGKFSMMEYAMLHFRESLEKTVTRVEHKNGAATQDWSWKEQADLIKWTRSPIQASLLKLDSPELNKVALECFIAIMRFMGDYPMGTNMSDYDCAKKILKTCHKYPQLRDEVFCQLCKQTTNNRSMSHKSKIRGWRLFAIVAAYFDCSDVLRPFLFKYLETTATDVQRTYNNAAALCLHNLRKTFKYGGRKDVPLKEEIIALADGRNCKRFPFFYSGADTQGGMLQVKSCTVVQDAIEDACKGLNITDNVEMEEYTFFVRTNDGSFSKLNREDYILDETAFYIRRNIHFNLIFQRTVWYFSLRHMDNEIFVEMMFHQCVLDYIEGFLVIMAGGKLSREMAFEVAYLGAVLHKANAMVGTPTLKDLEALIPRNVRSAKDSRPQHWLNLVHENLPNVARMTSMDARREFVDHLRHWRLFGSTFFLLKGIPNIAGGSLLAVNHEGITFLRRDSHETFLQHPFSEILSTRRYRDDNNANFLDMKVGNLMVQQILRIETDQGSDISDLIGQYMQVINRHRKRQDKSSPSPQP